MKKTLPLLAGALMSLAVGSSFAADTHFLADRHVAKGMACETCHTPDKKIKMQGDYEVCVTCHGDYKAMIKKTEGKYEVNPHAQHDGALPCTECHKGHKEGVNYCGGCHNYTYKVP